MNDSVAKKLRDKVHEHRIARAEKLMKSRIMLFRTAALGLEAPVMTPNCVIFLFFSFTHIPAAANAAAEVSTSK